MHVPTKENRPRSPKEQAGNFIASIGGMMKAGKHEAAIAARLADLIEDIALLKQPALVAAQCSRALTEWADVNRTNPDHAKELAAMCGNTAKGLPTKDVRALMEELSGERSSDVLQSQYEMQRAARRVMFETGAGEGPRVTPEATRPRKPAAPKARMP